MNIAVAIVAGIFALLGAIIGAVLGRRSDYRKWQRQERSTAFSEYLRQLHAVQKACLDLIHCEPGQESTADMDITEHFWSLAPQEAIVRLYLDAKDRDSFSADAKLISDVTSRNLPQGARHSRSEAALSRIQALLERSLDG